MFTLLKLCVFDFSFAHQELGKKVKLMSKRRSELLLAREMDKAQQQKAEASAVNKKNNCTVLALVSSTVLLVTVLGSGSSSPIHYVVFLWKTLYSGVWMGTSKLNAGCPGPEGGGGGRVLGFLSSLV